MNARSLLSNGHPSGTYQEAFARLAALQGSDPAFFVLAVHSFVEGFLRITLDPGDPADDNFYTILNLFRDELIRRANGHFIQGLDTLTQIKNQHKLTNDIRHMFVSATVDDARAATQHLRRFCSLANVPEDDSLEKVVSYIEAWDDRRCRGDLVKELNELGYKYHLDKKTSEQRAERLAALEKAEDLSRQLQEEIKKKDAELALQSEVKNHKDARIDELRAERSALVSELKGAKETIKGYEDVREYLEVLTRMTVLTRTRTDYERTILRLTGEQKRILAQIHLDNDFLIKGAAGTGKTLVLLKAIEKAKSGASEPSLGLAEIQGSRSIVLLTYTRTLVKYDQYMVTLLDNDKSASRISTADAYLLERFREIEPSASINFKLPEELAKQFPAAGLSSRELAAEVESFIWGNVVSYDEYVVQGIERRGMKRPLVKDQRMAVWSASEAMEAAMSARKVYTRNKAAILVAQAIAGGRSAGITRTDFIFIDEAQDLPAAVLMAIKACSSRCTILAGDSDQSIYQPGFSFKRAGFDIAGRTWILKTNFRNTVQVHELAGRYRCLSPGIDEDNQPDAFRDGPMPELFKFADQRSMLELLENRIMLFMKAPGYSPENICVIVPRDDDLEKIVSRLSSQGLSVSDIREKEFQFSTRDSIRLTTMHSAKGLDFPVVILYLPHFNMPETTLDQATTDRMSRNLIYVAMTRAMDHLDVIMNETTKNPAVIDLAAAFEAERSKLASQGNTTGAESA